MSTKRTTALFAAFLAATAPVTPAAAAPADALTQRAKIDLKARPFPLDQVKLLDGPFKDAMERDRKYLHALDPDRLLHTWRINAGLPTRAEPLGGWERPDCQVRGHTLGHYLSACALMYASTGDEKLKAKADAIVAELAKCQKAIGQSGYLSAFPEEFIERAEKCQPVWAPFYTLHKLFAGLEEMYVHCGNQQALEIAEKMAGWLTGRLEKIDDEQMQRMLDHTEQGGMNDALANLYALTGNEKYLALARRFDQRRYTEPLAAGEDKLQGEHVNSFIPNMIGTARQHEMTANARDRRIAEFFWDQVTGKRCYSTGGTSNHEHWRTPPGVLSKELGDVTQETCCTYNMLKLTRHLFCWDPQPKHADYYERALWTSILGTQNPKSGMMMYFVPLAAGRWKMYNLPNDAFWCCTGTGMENHAKYGDSIYFHGDDTLWVNQFIASEVDWKEKGVAVRQETDFPLSEKTSLAVKTEKPVRFTMKVRVPYWATRGVTATLNGKPLEGAGKGDAKPCSYLAVDRTWQDGDRLEVSLPMGLHAAPMPDDPTVVAFMVGPFVLAGKLGGEGLTEENTHTGENWYKYPAPAVAPPLLGDIKQLDAWIKPVEGEPLAFRVSAEGKEIVLVPYHRLFGQRYAVYWNVYKKDSPEYHAMLRRVEAEKARAARRIDAVEIGDNRSERQHSLKGEKTQSGSHGGRAWRHATDGGWFSYEMAVEPQGKNVLVCTYCGSDAGNRSFDVLVDGKKIASQKLDRNKPGEFFEVEHPLPDDVTRDKKRVTVTFRAQPGNYAGGVFGCEVLRAERPTPPTPDTALDIRDIPPDLTAPEMTEGEPGPGRRVKQTIAEYAKTGVYHSLYLPTDWQSGKRYPVIVEYAGNGGYRNQYGDVSTGLVEGSKLGYGISGGKGFIWVSMPYLSGDGTANVIRWWGTAPAYDPRPTLDYCKKAVPWICREYGGDPAAVVLAGFSRGAIACNFIGLADDEIALLWRAFVPYSHYDGVNERWGYPGADRAAALERLKRLRGRPQFICMESGPEGPLSLACTRRYLESTGVEAPFTFQATGFRNHDDAWTLRPSPARDALRRWLAAVLQRPQ